jgi:two-component system, NtrC family, sensor kinase
VKIRTKVVLLLSAVMLTLGLVEWGVGEALLLPRFEQIELDEARTAMMRIDHGVSQALAGLQVPAIDWGNWANTYRFVLDRDRDYVRENLNPSVLKQLHLTALAFIDLQGNFIWSHFLDAVGGAPVDLDVFAHGALPVDSPWRDNLRAGRPGHGLIATDHGVLLAAVAPVLDGFGHGPSRGLVLMGRLLTAAEIADIGARAQTSVALATTSGPGGRAAQVLPGDAARGAGADLTTTDTTVQVYRAFKDPYGRPVLTLRVDLPRTITARARTTVTYAMAFTGGAAVAVLLLLLTVLDKTVLAPLDRVTRHAVAIGAGDDLTTRLNLDRDDEIGALAVELDRMVDQVAESRRRLIDHSFHAGMAELSRGVLHNIGNAMTPLGVRLAKLQQNLRAAPTADLERALAEHGGAAGAADRAADLDEFVRLASAELAEVIKAAQSDAAVIARQAGLVQNALAEQLRSARGPTVVEAVALPAVISQSLEIVPDACRELISIELDSSVQAVGPVRLARTALRLVLQNLVINAAEAVRAAGRDRGVVRFAAVITAEGGADQLLLTCADTGVGIAAENLARVFEKGYSTKRGTGNLGIGLHWCATAVNALGGRIWASSDGPGHGATFHLLMPVPAAAAAPEAA